MNTYMKRLPVLALLLAMLPAAFAQEGKISVLNPRGTPPPTPLVPLAPRPASLEGKTVYFIDVKYEGGDILLKEIMAWFTANMPKTNLIFREKGGSYDQEDAALWAEAKQKGDAVVLAVGH